MILPSLSSARILSLHSLLLRSQSSGSQGMLVQGTSTQFSSFSSLRGIRPLFCLSFSISSKISIKYLSSSCSFSVELPIKDGSFQVLSIRVLVGVERLAVLLGTGLISFLSILSLIHSAAALGSTFFFSWLRMAMIFFLVSARFSQRWQVEQRQSWLIWCVRRGICIWLTTSISSFMHSRFWAVFRLCSATSSRSCTYSTLSSLDRQPSHSNTGISFRNSSAVNRFINKIITQLHTKHYHPPHPPRNPPHTPTHTAALQLPSHRHK